MADCLILIGISLAVIFAAFVVVAYLIVAEQGVAIYLRTGTWPRWSGLLSLLQPLREFARCGTQKSSRGRGVAVLGEVLTMAGVMFPLVVLPLLFGRLPALSIAAGCEVDLLLVAAAWTVGLVGRALSGKDVGREAGALMTILAATFGVTFVNGSLDLDEISRSQMQAGVWWAGVQPLGLAACCVGVASLFVGPGVVQHDPSARARFSLGEFVDRLRLIVVAYLAVGLFFGGWHVAGGDCATFGSRLWGVLGLHLKALLFMAVFVWCRARAMVTIGFRLPSGLWRFAFVLGGVNLVVVLLQEQVVGPGEWLLKSATNWIILAVCLSAASLVLDRKNGNA
jgi:NADH:ubiquinone oxidoreductase subunit H